MLFLLERRLQLNLLEFKKLKIAIHPLFLVLTFIMIALGYIEQFFILFLTVTLHELAHIFIAQIYGVKLIKIVFYPIGEMAILDNIFVLKRVKKFLIICAGPFINLVLGFIFLALGNNDIFKLISITNFSICIFNCIPIYPLDGGRILHLLLSNVIGILYANDAIITISKIFIFIIFIFGIIQVVLYPYNISLICLSTYLRSSIKTEEFNLSLDFFRNIFNKIAFINKYGFIKTDILTVSENICIKDILKCLKSDCMYKIYIVDKYSNHVGSITENQLIEFIIEYGTKADIKKTVKI